MRRIMPSGIGSKRSLKLSDEKDKPALVKANTGSTIIFTGK